jgi:hypothetical protein
MKILLSAAATALALTAFTGCSGDDDTPTADDPASKAPATSAATETPTVGSYPELAAADYTYVLEQMCFCPITGPVQVTVEDGVVTKAVILEGSPGVKKGSPAPDYLRITINDVIERANDPEPAHIDVEWPDDQDWPSKVAVDRAENATDDEVTYLVSDVQLG